MFHLGGPDLCVQDIYREPNAQLSKWMNSHTKYHHPKCYVRCNSLIIYLQTQIRICTVVLFFIIWLAYLFNVYSRSNKSRYWNWTTGWRSEIKFVVSISIHGFSLAWYIGISLWFFFRFWRIKCNVMLQSDCCLFFLVLRSISSVTFKPWLVLEIQIC